MVRWRRGANDSPGDREYFLGEVDDVLAAIDFVRARPDVDPTRVYVGGHSTGGTLALLVAASRPQVRAVFAFGPVAWVDYGQTGTALDGASDEELTIRSPIDSLAEATAPIFVIEGDQHANADQLAELGKAAGHAPVRLVLARGHTHFSDLAPATELIAARLVREAAGGPAFTLAEADLAAAR
jgi:dipeptidyl aminopeptidase/acylaminoacyl peptidase